MNDELPPEHHKRVEQHLSCCPPCVAYIETYRLTSRLTRRLPCAPLPEELLLRLRAAVEQPPPPSGGPSA